MSYKEKLLQDKRLTTTAQVVVDKYFDKLSSELTIDPNLITEWALVCFPFVNKPQGRLERNFYKQFKESLLNEAIKLSMDIKSNQFKYDLFREGYLIDPDGQTRRIAKQNVRDKLLDRILLVGLNKLSAPLFTGYNSYAYMPNTSPSLAVYDLIRDYRRNNIKQIVTLDIKNFFLNIEHEPLIQKLKLITQDELAIKLITEQLKLSVIKSDGSKEKNESKGLYYGPVLSPWLSNLYMHAIHEFFETSIMQSINDKALYYRYSDDQAILLENPNDKEKVIEMLSGKLAELGLSINNDKTQEFLADNTGTINNFTWLGYDILLGKDKFKISISSKSKYIKPEIDALKNDNLFKAYIKDQCKGRLVSMLKGFINFYKITNDYEEISSLVYEILDMIEDVKLRDELELILIKAIRSKVNEGCSLLTLL